MNHYTTWHYKNAYNIANGQESKYYQDHIEYCRVNKIPISEWVRKHNHIKMAW